MRSGEPRTTAIRPHVDHVAPLDGLRGVAILLVILPHLANAGMIPAPAWVLHAIAASAHGVDLFFVLSGFGLAYPFVAAAAAGSASTFDVISYAFNRVYRILPLFYLTMVLSLAVVFALRHFGHHDIHVLYISHGVYEAIAPFLLFDWSTTPVNPGLWTIPIQLRWYLLFPVMLALWIRAPRAFGAVLGAIAAAFVFTRARSMDLGTLPLFLFGIVAADVIARRRSWIRFAAPLLAIAVAVALAWDPHARVPNAWGEESVFIGQPTSFPWQIATFFLVLSVVAYRPLRALLAARPLRALGAASFSIYLVHQPVIEVMIALFGTHSGTATFAVCIAAGAAFWWCFERPLTNPQVRRKLRERARPFMVRVARLCGIPASVVLRLRLPV